jgi:very-short-patch-repair endonuclease
VSGRRVPTSPCKGEVDGEAGGRGSLPGPRFSRSAAMTSRARKLRKDLTEAEKKLWRALRRDQIGGLSFRRQHPIGPYVLDFYCPELGLAIEVDGGQHGYLSKHIDDERRSRWLSTQNVQVIRFWNNDVMQNLDGVLSEIVLVAQIACNRDLTPTPTLPLSGGGEEKPQ